MASRPHFVHLRAPRGPRAPDGAQTIVIALVLFAGIFALAATDGNHTDSEEVLYVVPIGLLALTFGLRGGLVGALVGLALIGTWDLTTHDSSVSVPGDACWAIAFLLLGTLLGSFVDHRRTLEAEISRYFDESLDLLATADQRGCFTRVNPAWERTLGHSAETLCSRPFVEFIHPDDRETTTSEHAAVAAGTRDAVGFRNRYRAADGSYRWLEWTGHTSQRGGLVHAIARDVTDQCEAEHQLANHTQVLEREVAERTRELQDAHAIALKRLSLAAEYRDDETFHHTERVGATSAEIGSRLGLEADQLDHLREAAPLHDIGKLAIPDAILLKPGKLSDEEYEVMKTHTTCGARLLDGSGSPVLQMATVIAESHHERWDGTGYPAGLAGEAIPLVGRIVAVADVFDALTHDRPYKSAWPVHEAILEIQQGAGSQFDPVVVAAFLAIHADAAAASPDGGPQEPMRAIDSRRRARATPLRRAGAHA